MKTAFELKGPMNTTAAVLLQNGKLAGRIVANYSDNPNGSVVTATVALYATREQGEYQIGTGKAGGYGYDKLSAAIYSAMAQATGKYPEGFSGGDGRHRELFESLGYEYIHVL